MSENVDADYFTERRGCCLRMAAAAVSPHVAAIHYELAARYAQLAIEAADDAFRVEIDQAEGSVTAPRMIVSAYSVRA